jgi:hypothetical protein
LPNKILSLEDVFRVKIYKTHSNSNQKGRPRYATIKGSWYSDDLKKRGVHMEYVERFDAILPDDFYLWYKPLRNSYTKVALEMLQKSIAKVKKERSKEKLVELSEELVARAIMPDEAETKDFREIVDQQSDPRQLGR